MGIHPTSPERRREKATARRGREWLRALGALLVWSAPCPGKGDPSAPLTKLSPKERKVLLQKEPLLDFLGVRDRSLVDSRDPLLDGRVDGLVLAADDLGGPGGPAAQLLTVLESFCRQVVSWLARLYIDIALRDRSRQVTSNC